MKGSWWELLFCTRAWCFWGQGKYLWDQVCCFISTPIKTKVIFLDSNQEQNIHILLSAQAHDIVGRGIIWSWTLTLIGNNKWSYVVVDTYMKFVDLPTKTNIKSAKRFSWDTSTWQAFSLTKTNIKSSTKSKHIALMLLCHSHDPGVITNKLHSLRDRIYGAIDGMQRKSQVGDKSVEKSTLASRLGPRRPCTYEQSLSSSFVSTASTHSPKSKH